MTLMWPDGITATMNVTLTQANAAGGAIVVEISPGAGNEFILLDIRAANSGTNGLVVRKETAVAGTSIVPILSVASGAGTSANGAVGLVSTVFTSNAAVGIGWPCIVSGTQALLVAQTGAGAQNDTFQVLINIRVRGSDTTGMTVTKANSTNPANVSVTAGALSFSTL